MSKYELSDLEIKVLKLVKETLRRNSIRLELSLTHEGTKRIFKKLKELGYTNTFVGRHTVISEKGKDLLNIS